MANTYPVAEIELQQKGNIYDNRYKNAECEKLPVIECANTLPGMIYARQERAQNNACSFVKETLNFVLLRTFLRFK